jgi:hypothetical protein
MAICMAHLSAAPVPLPPAVADSKLGPIIERATRKRATERYESAAAMLSAVEAVTTGASSAISGSIRLDGDRVAALNALDATEALPTMGHRAPVVPRASRKRGLVIGLTLAAGAAALAGWIALRPPAPAAEPTPPAAHQDVLPAELVSAPAAAPSASAVASASAPPTIPGVPFPDGDWSAHAPKRRLLPFDGAGLKKQLTKLGWKIDSGSQSNSEVADMHVLVVSKGLCRGNVQYHAFKHEKDSQQAAEHARSYDEYAFLIEGPRILVLGIAAARSEDARTCVLGLFQSLTRP